VLLVVLWFPLWAAFWSEILNSVLIVWSGSEVIFARFR